MGGDSQHRTETRMPQHVAVEGFGFPGREVVDDEHKVDGRAFAAEAANGGPPVAPVIIVPLQGVEHVARFAAQLAAEVMVTGTEFCKEGFHVFGMRMLNLAILRLLVNKQ